MAKDTQFKAIYDEHKNLVYNQHILLVDKTRRIRGIYNGTLKLKRNNL